MSTKKDSRCLEKAYPDENIFVLLSRDHTSPKVICEWIKQNIGIQPREKLIAALDTAIAMHKQYSEITDRKNNICRCPKQGCVTSSITSMPWCMADDCPGRPTQK